MLKPIALGATLATFAIVASANAVPPMLISIGLQDRHPIAMFSAPRASYGSIAISRKPDHATDGNFLSENRATGDSFTDDELQRGTWKYEDRLDPGIYYAMLNVSPVFSSCDLPYPQTGYDPACANGFSNVVAFSVPTPVVRYSTKTDMLRNIRIGYMQIKADPLGIDQPYELCYRKRTGKKWCVKGTIDGYSWDDDANDMLRIRLSGLGKRTKFTWYVGGKAVASRTVKT